MQETILKESYNVVNDEGFIRITTATTFFHSVIVILLVLNSINTVLQNTVGKGVGMSDIINFIQTLFIESGFTSTFIILLIIFGIGYFLLHPIGESSMIFYLENNDKNIPKAFSKGLGQFFPMFEFQAMNGIGFNLLSFLFITLRIYIIGVLFNPVVLVILGIWLTVIFGIMILRPYTKFIITLENKKVMEAISKSITMSVENFGTTLRFVVIGFLLQIRFLINTFIVLGVPLIIIYFAVQNDLIKNEYINYTIYSSIILGIIITAYINGIIEAYFMAYRYKLYKAIK